MNAAAPSSPSQNESCLADNQPLDSAELRRICLAAGADDVGFVEVDRPILAPERAEIESALRGARTVVGFVRRMNREPIRAPARSLANAEFHHTTDEVNETGREIAAALTARGVRALNVTAGFPMEMARFPGEKIWVLSHKIVAEAAGLGKMGIHRNVIHPRFGSFVLLGSVLIDAEVTARSAPIDFNPCLTCKLCVAVCPVGAISPDGAFNFSACYTHNYREFMGGFSDWVEQIAESRDAHDYRRRVSNSETVSWWQSLSFGANYKSAYCIAACPAGTDVIAPFKASRSAFTTAVVRPLQEKVEPVYVVPGSDAEAHVRKRFPHKTPRLVGNGLRSQSIDGFLRALPLVFQPGQAKDLHATYHFTFTGEAVIEATVVIDDGKLTVARGHSGTADLHVSADARTWLRFLAKEQNIVLALLMRRIRLEGPIKLLKAFGRCFPS